MNHPTLRSALLTLPFLLPALPAFAQSAKWDQTKVTALAVELSEVAVELRSSFRREPRAAVGTGQARARAMFQDSLRVLGTETRALAAELEAGGGLDETWPIARRLRVVVRDLREEGRRISFKDPVASQARRADELVTQLAPFFFDVNAPVQESTSGEPAPAEPTR
ncbi:MAG TPA: hypothetical protein VFY49_13340 [Myxococcota bacterium]|nr:hypothetical protein [Myxococcota bacterium]